MIINVRRTNMLSKIDSINIKKKLHLTMFFKFKQKKKKKSYILLQLF